MASFVVSIHNNKMTKWYYAQGRFGCITSTVLGVTIHGEVEAGMPEFLLKICRQSSVKITFNNFTPSFHFQ